MLDFTKNIPHLTLTGELWGVLCEYFWENWSRYNGTTLYWIQLCLTNDQSVTVTATVYHGKLTMLKWHCTAYNTYVLWCVWGIWIAYTCMLCMQIDEELNDRSRFLGQGKITTSHSNCRMYLLVPVPGLNVYASMDSNPIYLWECISNFILHIMLDVITYPSWN